MRKPIVAVRRFPGSETQATGMAVARSERPHLILLVVCIAATVSGGFLAADDLLIKARRVYTMTGPPLEPGSVLVSNGKIVQIGASVETTAGAKVVDLGDGVLMPGLVDPWATVNVVLGSSELTREVTPDFRVLTAINWNSRGFRESLDEGVTCLHVVPGTDNVIGGVACVVKSAGERTERIVQAESGLVITLASDPSEGNRSRSRPDSIYVRQPTNRMGVVWVLRSTLDQVGRKRNGPGGTEATSGGENPPPPATAATGKDSSPAPATKPLRVAPGSPLVRMLDGKLHVMAVARTDFDMLSLMSISREFGFSPTVVGGQEAYRIADRLAKAQMPVILAPLTTGAWEGADGTELFWNVSGKLHAAGATFAFSGGRLLEQARFAVRFGLAPDVALQAITATPARLLGADQRVGTLAPGRDADLLALNGEPLEFTTSIRWVMVNGKIYNEGE